MPHPKKKPRVMTYYIIINKATRAYFVNKSTRPIASVRHHFHRANNPDRADYNCEFYKDIRKYGQEGFDISYSLNAPIWMVRRAHYMPPIEGLTIEEMRGRHIIEQDEKFLEFLAKKEEKYQQECAARLAARGTLNGKI